MFLGILSWMLANVPSFMRPGVSWLVDGLRRITGHISSLWNNLGLSVGAFFMAVANWRGQLANFVVSVSNGFWWVRHVYIPARLNALHATISGIISSTVAIAYNALLSIIWQVEQWVSDRIYEFGRWVGSIVAWASAQLAKLEAFVLSVVRALVHVTSGPAVLAEWLLGALYHAALQRLYAERDRIFQWVMRGSVSFTIWIARTLEDMIVRML